MAMMLVAALALAGCGSPTSPSAAPSASPDATSIGYAFVAALAAGDAQSAQALEDTAMLNAAPADNLLAIWHQLLSQYGGLQTLGRPVAASQPPYINVSVPATFAQATVTLLVTVSTAGRVAGFHIGAVSTAPPSGPAATPTPSPPPASYVDPSKFRETAVTVGSSPWALPGTMSIPRGSGPFPAVVLIAGSGPADRDETFGPNKPLRDLAWGLASAGIAVLRYDKRTDTYDALMSALPNITVKQETMDDVVAAVTLLNSTPGIDTSRIFLVGHSLGAYLAPRIAAQLPGQVDGLAMLEDFSTPLPELILNQAHYLVSLTPSPGPSVQAVLANLEAQVQRAESPDLSASTPPSELPLDVPASYWLDLRTYDPIATVTSLKLPMFFSQGSRDYQVPPSELQPYQAALSGRDNVVFNSYPAMDHLLLDGTGTPGPAEYNIPGHVDAQLVADLAAWITAH
jgi:pimeloyl-ACP methyl ester carboxylesterase